MVSIYDTHQALYSKSLKTFPDKLDSCKRFILAMKVANKFTCLLEKSDLCVDQCGFFNLVFQLG